MTRQEAFGIVCSHYANLEVAMNKGVFIQVPKDFKEAEQTLDLFGVDSTVLQKALNPFAYRTKTEEVLSAAEAEVESGEITTSEQFIDAITVEITEEQLSELPKVEVKQSKKGKK